MGSFCYLHNCTPNGTGILVLEKINSIDQYHREYQKSVESPESFWEEIANTFQWESKWNQILEWEFRTPEVKWFSGAQLNITYNLLDRHLKERPNHTAIIWEPNSPKEESIKISYQELYERVCTFSNVLKKQGVKKGDRICLYMPMVPELAIGMLACARVGAIHSVVFAGFSAKSLANRMNDAECSILITSDGLYRGNKQLCLKDIVDEALENCTSVHKVLVFERTKQKITMKPNRDVWIHEELSQVENDCPAEIMDSEDPLFILYTSGSTGKPKGVQHHCGGYMVYAEYSFRNVFQYNQNDVYWCTADIGWITGHSYIVYGPLLAGATTLIYEGVPTWPDGGRFWEIIDKHKVNIFYTAPTAIRALQALDVELVRKHDLGTLKTLGSVGEPINEEAWEWYRTEVGKTKCPIVDTWWQTETGGIMISPLAGITKTKPSFATLPLPGVQPCLVDNEGNEIHDNPAEGNLCIKFPWPSMIRSTWGDHERCRKVYFSTFKEKYFTGDGARRDKDGFYRITGRIDDVINVSGHRFGTAEIEDAIDEHKQVIECAVVGYPHDIKGQGIYAYIILESNKHCSEDLLRTEIISLVADQIGAIAKPDKIQFVNDLPKTRSGKIMRRILRKIAESVGTGTEVSGESLGDISTLLNPHIVEEIKGGTKHV